MEERVYGHSEVATTRVVLTKSGIRIQNAQGSSELQWWEIAKVSGSARRIRLHNQDGGVTLELDPGLLGYSELVEFIGNRRPDLFEKEEFKSLSMAPSQLRLVGLVIVAFVAGGAALLFLVPDLGYRLLGAGLAAFGFLLASVMLPTPLSVSLKDNELRMKSLFRERAALADDIRDIDPEGLPYYTQLLLADGEKVNLGAMREGAPITYLVVKRWLTHWQKVSLESRFPGVLSR